MLVKLLKWQSVLLIIILSSVACSKDSDEEYSGGGTTASSAKFLVSSTIPEDHATGVSLFTSVLGAWSRHWKGVMTSPLSLPQR